jgi:hypothetical protein
MACKFLRVWWKKPLSDSKFVAALNSLEKEEDPQRIQGGNESTTDRQLLVDAREPSVSSSILWYNTACLSNNTRRQQ